jgi:NADPH-dependent 2,4-dienoyl-CoA reductase/sulfur reductase-like enzyme
MDGHPARAGALSAGIALRLARKVVSFEKSADAFYAVLDNGEKLPADLVVMSVGVKPNSELAQAAGLELGPRGHIAVDDTLRTSDPSIYAAGDVIEVTDPILGGKTAIPLAGPANKQARIVADNLVGRSSHYRGSYGTAVLKVGTLAAGGVGLTSAA